MIQEQTLVFALIVACPATIDLPSPPSSTHHQFTSGLLETGQAHPLLDAPNRWRSWVDSALAREMAEHQLPSLAARSSFRYACQAIPQGELVRQEGTNIYVDAITGHGWTRLRFCLRRRYFKLVLYDHSAGRLAGMGVSTIYVANNDEINHRGAVPQGAWTPGGYYFHTTWLAHFRYDVVPAILGSGKSFSCKANDDDGMRPRLVTQMLASDAAAQLLEASRDTRISQRIAIENGPVQLASASITNPIVPLPSSPTLQAPDGQARLRRALELEEIGNASSPTASTALRDVHLADFKCAAAMFNSAAAEGAIPANPSTLRKLAWAAPATQSNPPPMTLTGLS
mmetsp:Transcript_17164/g.44511  ORF Transcript_17164/g.44511 Transcript_17164/m.44511 type:complete len:341 (+) Transcript_17164:845-1867(+)